ncbi:serine carboxypeptidase-like 15 isoform X2 [Raphanus sativus]|uniref:Serine carboxypeptidase-like 15 isoform X2 n=1 Tax=Raphanus sativus TaxID=3726 RepID=A0A9W3C054_RAPSA|nr:serine carboxypeptidase-like 15 isoform X2 [Raphanus sativus]
MWHQLRNSKQNKNKWRSSCCCFFLLFSMLIQDLPSDIFLVSKGLFLSSLKPGPLSFNIESDNGDIPSLVANIIYLDQPVGTGFPYSRNSIAEIPSDTRSAKLVNEFVHNWLTKHPEYYSNPFYVTGNSYSGIVVPAIVQEISNENGLCCKPLVNLQGYVLGNPVTDFNNNDNWRIPFAHGMALIS